VRTTFSAVVLAGGQSTRMGRPKADIEVGGIPLWRRQVDLVAGLNPSKLMISVGEGWMPADGRWTVVRDRVPGLGPLGGIQAALGSMSADFLLVLAVDMPSMSRGFLERLIKLAGTKGVVPEENGAYEGLAAIYPGSIGPIVDEALGREDRSLQSMIRRAIAERLVEALPIAEQEKPLFRNVNSPADL
jgi:molybdopterin-guanine dinucleotide biosynthesis protein A